MSEHRVPPAYVSRLRPVGAAHVGYQNPYFKVVEQPMDFLGEDGQVRRSAADGGQMNYVDMNPGALIVCVDGNSRNGSVLVAPQERYTTNLAQGKPVRHYELPGGGFDENPQEIIDNARRELVEEFGVTAEHMEVVGPTLGHMPHPSMTDRNVTVVAHGISSIESGHEQEATEAIGQPAWFSWDEATQMYLHPEGLQLPSGEFAVISSEPTIASIGLARAYLAQQELYNDANFLMSGEMARAGMRGGQFS